MVIKNDYNIGDIVFLKTDSEQKERIIFCLRVYDKEILYEVAMGTSVSCHYNFELTDEKDVMKTTTN